jgi:(Z)-2-((N-methylformamido)methylene)-5-hydroxybutyrolactone dehydrogenase
MTTDYGMFIGGEWVPGSTDERLHSVNPFNREIWATVPQASEDDVESALSAAHDAFENSWRSVNGLRRAELMMKLADLLDANASKMARMETTDNGKVIRETEKQVRFAARNYRFFAGYADKLYGEVIPLDNTNLFDYTLREPLGVVVAITAWNSPIQLLTNKLAPALAAGNTVVAKPSEQTSVTTLELGKLVEEAGFPEGVVNIVTGDGRVGDALTKSPSIGKISLTGGPHTGRIIARNASHNLVPVTLELGGKSPNIIFSDADLERAINGAMAGIFGAAGQTCIAGSRLLVERTVYDEVVNKLAERAQAIRLGNPLNQATEMGPVATEAQYETILERIYAGRTEGAEIVAGGEPARGGELEKGFFISPTIFKDVDNQMTIAQEEIFGPVLSVIPFEGEEEAVQIANGTKYGLASGLWTRDLARAHRLSRWITAGTVWVNTYRNAAAQAPFGGVKQSGYGRERGWHALLEYTHVKNVMVELAPEATEDPFSIRS